MINRNDNEKNRVPQEAAKPGADVKIPKDETVKESEVPSAETRVEKFINAGTTEKIKQAADEILEADDEVDVNALQSAADQFKKEKKEDKMKQAKNDAEFDQP